MIAGQNGVGMAREVRKANAAEQKWEKSKFSDLRKGDVFCMFEYNGAPVTQFRQDVFLATSDPFDRNGVPTVKCAVSGGVNR